MKKTNYVAVLLLIMVIILNSSCIIVTGDSNKQISDEKYEQETLSEYDFNEEGFNKFGYNRDGYLKRELDDNGKPLLAQWGLSGLVTESVSMDKDYDWYIDQGNSGYYSDVNCVPASCVMALKWINKDYKSTVEDARNEYIDRYSLNGGWDNLNAEQYLKENGARVSTIQADCITVSEIIEMLNNNSIIMLNLQMNEISNAPSLDNRVGRPYCFTGDAQHEIIIKGYRVVDDVTYFEVYDPGSMDIKRADGTPIGKNIYYPSEEVLNASKQAMGSLIILDGTTYDFGQPSNKSVSLGTSIDAAIREELGIKNRQITEDDLKHIFTLRIIDTSIENIDEIKLMENLDTIIIINCGIDNISFVKQFKNLQRLSVSNNKIKDISAISELKELKVLHLNNNNISEVSPILNLSKLEELQISGNPIKDISVLKEMDIEYSDINECY